MLAFASLFGLVGGFLLGAAVALPDALSETWGGLWMISGLVGAPIGLGVALVTAVVWILVRRRTRPEQALPLVLLPPVVAFSVVLVGLLAYSQSTAVFAIPLTWFLSLGAALAAMVSLPWVGWSRKV